jgi:hypothetical protein
MKTAEITKLKTRTIGYLDLWKAKGGKTGGLFCPHCNKPNETTIPTKKDVSSKGYWDSLTTCYECGGLFMSYRYVGGEIKVFKPE